MESFHRRIPKPKYDIDVADVCWVYKIDKPKEAVRNWKLRLDKLLDRMSNAGIGLEHDQVSRLYSELYERCCALVYPDLMVVFVQPDPRASRWYIGPK